MRQRTKAFALRIIRLVETFPATQTGRVLGQQLLRADTSVGADYLAACRAKSKADFISKMGTVEEETDDTMHRMELVIEAGLMEEELFSDLYHEADEIPAIVVASIKTARASS